MFTLQETMAFSKTSPTTASLNPTKLQLGRIQEVPNSDPLSYPRYRQYVSYDGLKLILQTRPVRLERLQYNEIKGAHSVIVPVDNWLRQQLNIIEDYVVSQVEVPTSLVNAWPFKCANMYKPFYAGQEVYFMLGKYCTFTQGPTVEGSKILPSSTLPCLGSGLYSFTIEVPNVYIGPHKEGYLYSVNTRIIGIHQQPDIDDKDEQEFEKACTSLESTIAEVVEAVPQDAPPVKKLTLQGRRRGVGNLTLRLKDLHQSLT